MFVKLTLLLVVGCIRWDHQKRSTLTSVTHKYLIMWCARGKSRQNGSRRPFYWYVPRFLRADEDTLGDLHSFLLAVYEANSQARYVVPDIKLARQHGSRGALGAGSSWQLHKPMPQKKFLELFRGLLLSCGVQPAFATSASYNTLRRFSPPRARFWVSRHRTSSPCPTGASPRRGKKPQRRDQRNRLPCAMRRTSGPPEG